MAKLIPDAHVHSDDLEWRPWDDQRKAPFITDGAHSQAWVKVLSRDPETEGETLMYRLDPGWSSHEIENTVNENLLVLEGTLDVDGTRLRKRWFSYRPEGHRTRRVSTETGATVIAIAGFPGELASPIPVPWIDTDAMEWVKWDVSSNHAMKMLRGDEENLDVYFLARVEPGFENGLDLDGHDAPEEAFFLEGRGMNYDGHTRGRHINTAGTYVHRGPGSQHGLNTVTEQVLLFKHDSFNHEESSDRFLSAYPRETEAVRSLKEGRVPVLPKRW
jgi:ChrR Cupin-like domain